MIQRDYILRLTQQIAQLIAKLIGKSAEEKLEYIDEAYDEWLRMDGKELEPIPKEEILNFLIQIKGFNVYQMELVAELLVKQGASLFEIQQFSSAKDRLKKSLIIFEHVDEKTQLYSLERIASINKAKELLAK